MKKAFAILMLLAAGAVAENNCVVVTGVKGEYNLIHVLQSCGTMEKAKNAVKEYAKEKGKNPENVFPAGQDGTWYHFLILD